MSNTEKVKDIAAGIALFAVIFLIPAILNSIIG